MNFVLRDYKGPTKRRRADAAYWRNHARVLWAYAAPPRTIAAALNHNH